MTNLREMILKTEDLKIEKLYVEEWGMDVFVKELSTKQVIDLYKKLEKDITMAEYSVFVAIESVVDENGEKQFEASDYDALIGKNMGALNTIQEKVRTMSDNKDEAKKK